MTDRMNSERPADNTGRGGGLARRSDYGTGLSPYSYGRMSPFEMMRRFSEDVDRMFSQMGFGGLGEPSGMGLTGRSSGTTGMGAWSPTMDVVTRGNDLVIDLDLPGMKPEDINVECDDNSIIVSGQTSYESQGPNQGQSQSQSQGQGQNRGYRYTERRYGSFYRQIPLPPGVNGENAQATFNNGVLEITLPNAVKQLEPQRRKIQVQGAQNRSQQSQQSQSSSQSTGDTGTTASQARSNQ